MTNHLENVLGVISDKKKALPLNDTLVDHYVAEVLSQSDYYPFGMLMPGRNYDAASLYRYGFNGKENDNEVKGVGDQQDYGMRIYDPRAGRFLSVDPLTNKYPSWAPYPFAMNSPIDGVDLDGEEWSRSTTMDKSTGQTTVSFSIDVKYVSKDPNLTDEQVKASLSVTENVLADAFNAKADKNTKYTFSIHPTKISEGEVEKASQTGLVLELGKGVAPAGEAGNNNTNTQTGIIVFDPYANPITNWDPKSKSFVSQRALFTTDELGHGLAHEFLHGARVSHPYEENRILDIAQYIMDKSGHKIRSSVPDNVIRSNIMNSPGNPIPALRPSNFIELKGLTTGQVQLINKVVDFEQKQKK